MVLATVMDPRSGELPDSGTLTTTGAQAEEPVVSSSRVEQLRVISVQR